MNALPFVDMTAWTPYHENFSYPYGRLPKSLLISPSNIKNPFKTNHYYLFKTSKNNFPKQYWSEIIAYHIGTLMGLKVPPAYPAVHRSFMGEKKYGVAVEWFLKMPTSREFQAEALLHGGEWMQAWHNNYDTKKGKQHNLTTILAVCKILESIGGLKDWEKYWCEALCFDTVIGNTDRHHDNWGFIINMASTAKEYRFSPLFDNSTSLGYEWFERQYSRFNDSNYLLRYLNKGYHHMKYYDKELDKFGGEPHFNMLLLLCTHIPKAREWMVKILPSSDDILQLKDILYQYNTFKSIPEIYSLSEKKIEFTLKLIKTRITLIENTING